MYILPEIIEHHLLQWLSPKTLIAISLTNKYYKSAINEDMLIQNIINKINYRLYTILGNNIDIFKTYLTQNRAFISGSFIVQCILYEFWDNDIDVFYVYSHESFHYNHQNTKIKFYKDIGFAYNDYKESYLSTNYKSNKEIFVNATKKAQILAQSIFDISPYHFKRHYDYDSSFMVIMEIFDASVLQNMYYIDEDGKEKIVVKGLREIMNKINKVRPQKYSPISISTIGRCQEYNCRGFLSLIV